MAYNPKDFYFKKAKTENFAARSVYKLEEIDQKFRIFLKNDKVLDLGCAPGSWSQYASKAVGGAGLILGIDLQKVAIALPNVEFVQGDAFGDMPILDFIKSRGVEKFNIVMSDMAPKTTGIRITDQQRSLDLCLRALEVADRWLLPKGHFIIKFFNSNSFQQLQGELKKRFEKVEILRPKSTRKSSYEIFLIGKKKLI